MQFDFDTIIERRGTDSLKYDFAQKRGMPKGILPLWVADMDFAAPPAVLDALEEKSRHGVFGYSESGEDYFAALQGWMKQSFDWEISPRWLIKMPGVVYAVATAVRALTQKGDAVLIQQPVYYPFAETIELNERKLVVNQLVYRDGAYEIDLEDFERKIIENNVKMFILCSPHNPVGRVWTKAELMAMGEICVRHNVLVVADEIHADFVYPGHTHHVFAGLSQEFADKTVTCTAPTKTFNLAGVQIANIFASNAQIHRALRHEMAKSGYSQLGIMGIVACKAAYAHGQEWLDALRVYLGENLAFVRSFLQQNIPQIRLVEPQGTYLIWLDCSALGMTDKELDDFMVHKAGLWLDGGTMFGAGGEGFQRINIACPRATLTRALKQLATAVEEL